MSKNDSRPEIALEAEKILNSAREKGLTLKLLGGLGVSFVAPSTLKEGYSRTYRDIDFMGYRKESQKIEKLFVEIGYKPREMFNKLQGDSRLMFTNPESGRRVDIFLDKFVMCHEFDMKDRLKLSPNSLPPADLLLTKLQIVEINQKDIMDIAALLLDVSFSDSSSGIELKRILEYTSNDWGIYKTLTQNLDKTLTILPELGLPKTDTEVIAQKVRALRAAIEDAPKSFSWKMRARVGERVKWYELPEAA